MNKELSSALLAACLLGPAAAQRPNAPNPGDQAPFGVYEEVDGSVRADGARYRAHFRPDAVELRAPAPEQNTAESALSLRFVGTRRGAHRSPAGGATPRRSGAFVCYEHAGVREVYELGASGYEQSFEFAARPAGHGDLVVEIDVTGNVTADAVGARHQALEFRRDGDAAIRYGEAWAFDRGGRRVDVRTSYDGRGRIELHVPAAFVEAATYPIVVDPVVGPALNPGGTFYEDTNPDVAYSLDDGTYMVVWQRIFGPNDTALRCQRYDRDGNGIGLVTAVASGGVNEDPAVAYHGGFASGSFAITWQRGGVIYVRLHSAANGQPLNNAFPISSPPTGAADAHPAISGPGTGVMMVAWQRTPPGAQAPKQILLRRVTWSNPTSIALSPEHTIESVTDGHVHHVQLARSDTRWQTSSWFQNRAVWERFYTTPAPGDYDLRTAAFRVEQAGTGFVITHGPTMSASAASIGIDERSADIGSRAERHDDPQELQYCVAWQEGDDVRAHMFDQDGPLGAEITVRADPNRREFAPTVGAGYCEFTVAYGEVTPPNEFRVDFYAARLLLDGTVAVDHRPVDVPNGPFQGGIRASSRPIDDGATQRTNTTLLTWFGATSATTDVRACFFEPVAPTVVPFGVGCPGPAGELPTIGTSGGQPIPGNDEFGFTVSDAPPGSLAVLLASDVLTTSPLPGAPGCTLLVGLPLLNAFPTVVDAAGDGGVPLPMPCPLPPGTTLAFQWAIYSPAANAFGWIVSNDLDVSWSQ